MPAAGRVAQLGVVIPGDDCWKWLDIDDSAGAETVLAFAARPAEALTQGLIDGVPQSVRLKFRAPSAGPPSREEACWTVALRAAEGKAERDWKPPLCPSDRPANDTTRRRYFGLTRSLSSVER